MNKQILTLSLLATVMAAPAFAANDTYNATLQTGAKSQPFPAASMTATAPVSAPGAASGLPASEVAADTPPAAAVAAQTATPATAPEAAIIGAGQTEVVPMPAMAADGTMVAPAPILGGNPAVTATTAVATTQQPMPMPAMQAATNVTTQDAMPAPMGGAAAGNPLCAAVMAAPHVPAADVAAAGAAPAVNPPRTIPLSVDLAGALGIQGFQNIVSEGPIGFITVDQGGRVWFEGRELTQNAQNLCASGNVPAAGVASPARAPDGSTYSSMPGQGGMRASNASGVATAGTGFSRMQPIVDGPKYKTPPKKKAVKKAAPKPKAAEDDKVTEETVAPEAAPTSAESATTSVMPASEAEGMPEAAPANDEANLKSMMRKPAATETAPGADPVPMAPKTTPGAEPAATAEPAPTEPQTGAAVQEVLDN